MKRRFAFLALLLLASVMTSRGQSTASLLNFDPSFVYTSNIPYATMQATDIQNTATSVAVAGYKLIDGNGVSNDADATATVVSSITFAITTSGVAGSTEIRRIALYNSAGGEIQEQAYSGASTVTFSGLAISAPDFGSTTFSVRMSFNSVGVVDNHLIQLQITNVGQGAGSLFNPSASITGGSISGGVVTGATLTSNINNFINVIATKLDFTTQPAPYAGINQSGVAGIVTARDQFGFTDLVFSSSAIVSSPGAIVNGSFTFVGGVLDLSVMTYGSVGDGTPLVTSLGLSSVMNNTVNGLPNISIPSTHVDVVNISTTRNDGGPGGVTPGPTARLKAGVTNQVIFGFTFNSAYSIPGTPNNPRVSSFTISFSTSITNVFQNMRVYESTTGAFSALLPEVTLLSGSYTSTSSSFTVNFAIPRDLYLNPNLSYFLIADVSVFVSSSTPFVVPSLIDTGVGSPSESNIIASVGSQFSNVSGPSYRFGSNTPIFQSSYPAVAQSNVDITQSTIELTFNVPVQSLDNKIQLWDKTLNTSFILTSPAPLGGAQPLIFNIPPGLLAYNHEYYVLIAPGNFTTSSGIVDMDFNLWPGISYPGTLYFKTANGAAPKLLGSNTSAYAGANAVFGDPNITNLTSYGATLNATFDKKGKAYFMVLQNPGAPTNAMIKGFAPYFPPADVVARGVIDVNTTTTNQEFGIIAPFSGSFIPGATHYVWIFTEAFLESNHTVTTIPTSLPYGSVGNSFAEGTSGPTLTFTSPAAGTNASGSSGPFMSQNITTNSPIITFCSNSSQIVSSPIIFYEGINSSQQFNQTLIQTMNLELPAGFSFDVSTTSGIPNYGKVTLLGSDFPGGSASGTLSYLSPGVMRISFMNNATTSRDMIIISGMKITSSGSGTGSFFRIGGNGIPQINDGSPVAYLDSRDGPKITLDNSYSQFLGNDPNSAVTMIPDNFSGQKVTLLPVTTDFGPTTFSGPGINVDVLNLAGVVLDAPFNITVNHTDVNGCSSQNDIQFTVYDHITGIGGLPTNFCSVNVNFPNTANTGTAVHQVPFDNLVGSGYYMESLAADIPSSASPGQVIYGPQWQSVIQSLPIQGSSHSVFGNTFHDYHFDEAVILNATGVNNPYATFMTQVNSQLIYYKGGSLGIVEFTGQYRSISNPSLLVPRKQQVEFFVPPIPVIDALNPAAKDATDPLNPTTSTYAYCEFGGVILVNGYPAASAGASIGTFKLFDLATGATLYDYGLGLRPAGFVDNSNGTATLDPAIFKNNFKDIKITYTYQDNNSPCQGIGTKIVRVLPSPVAGFTLASVIGPNTPTSTALCTGVQINFLSSSTVAAGSTITSGSWDFGDLLSGAANVAAGISASHVFNLPSTYVIKFSATSNWGCSSAPYSVLVKVAGIPVVKFKTSGISTLDSFVFSYNDDPANASSGNSSISSNDTFASFTWDYGDGTPPVVVSGTGSALPANPSTHTYSTSGQFVASLKINSGLGCINTLSRGVYVLPGKNLTVSTSGTGTSYNEDFESTSGNWNAMGTNSSWEWASPDAGKTLVNPELVKVGQLSKMWVTNKSGKYNSNEKSYLYSPALQFNVKPGTNYFVAFNKTQYLNPGDGVVLQYSIDALNILDPLKKWVVVGDNLLGSFWYNNNFVASNPGDQTVGFYGWTGTQKWERSAFSLDQVITASYAGTNPGKIVFRFALSSINNGTTDGVAIDNFRIGYDVAKPTIVPTKTITQLSTTKNDTIKFSVADDVSLKKLIFAFKNVSAAGWSTVDFSEGLNGTPRGVSSSTSVIKNFTSKEIMLVFDHAVYDAFGLKYYFRVDDLLGSSVSTDTTKLTFKYTAGTSPPIPNLKFGGAATDWRMFSIPYKLDDPSINTLFGSLGPPGEKTWRLLTWNSPGFDGYQEKGNLQNIDQGKGYWFNAMGGLIADIKIGKSSAPESTPSSPFVLKLKQGWNQIGNPYPVNMIWTNVLTYNKSTSTSSLKKYNGGLQLEAAVILGPFEGAYVFSDNAVDLKIPISDTNQGGRMSTEDTHSGWQLDLVVQKNEMVNKIGGIGMMDNALAGYDRYDEMRVPRFASFVDMTFQHPEYFYPNFSKDVVPVNDHNIWKFDIEANDGPGTSTLTWDDQQLNDATGELYLHDLATEMVVNMRQVQHYNFELSGKVSFEVYYGNSEFILKNLNPEKMLLGNNYPNPFRNITIIPLSLPGNGLEYHVNLTLLDINGKELAQIVNSKFTSGFYEVKLDRNDIAAPLAAGLYLYKVSVQSGDFYSVVTKKLMIE